MFELVHRPSSLKRLRPRLVRLTFGFLAIGDGMATDMFGYLDIIGTLLVL